jgi:hypothetical protein
MANLVPFLAERLRKYNPKIGAYKSTIVNQRLNYVARFSNGKLEIPQEMYEVYKASRMTEDELEFLARHFRKYEEPFLVERLRKYNQEMGEYKSVIINEHVNHVVRFSNGLLELPKELYDKYEAADTTEHELESLAKQFKKYEEF